MAETEVVVEALLFGGHEAKVTTTTAVSHSSHEQTEIQIGCKMPFPQSHPCFMLLEPTFLQSSVVAMASFNGLHTPYQNDYGYSSS
ncbi:hypothetical protein HanRHA438_Chr05g0231361 [Helianthus annuus]|nr:hypothetical protein HanIR_Chr05g0239231 [Helianthus annuus]KAJ0919588.1 hypothetical protein HanRHA438_Chr05g0231361 [Helianthus annuus]